MKHIAKFALLIVALVALLLTTESCSKKSSPVDVQDTTLSYYPLKAGNWWRYESWVPTFAEHHRIVTVLRERHVGSTFEYDLVDSIFNASMLSTKEEYTLVVSGTKVWESNNRWLIDFASTSTDGNEFHGYVTAHADTITVPAGVFRDVVSVYYPASARDAMPFQEYAKGIGLVRNQPHGIPTHLVQAYVNGRKYNW